MSAGDLARFRSIVFENEGLQATLWDVLDREEFAALVVRLAGERGLCVTLEDVRSACADGMTAWLQGSIS
jgi:hypothetical protein